MRSRKEREQEDCEDEEEWEMDGELGGEGREGSPIEGIRDDEEIVDGEREWEGQQHVRTQETSEEEDQPEIDTRPYRPVCVPSAQNLLRREPFPTPRRPRPPPLPLPPHEALPALADVGPETANVR
jgi:hypothetical protein